MYSLLEKDVGRSEETNSVEKDAKKRRLKPKRDAPVSGAVDKETGVLKREAFEIFQKRPELWDTFALEKENYGVTGWG